MFSNNTLNAFRFKNNNSVSIVPVSYALFLYSQHPCPTKPFVYIKIKKTFINTLPFKTKTHYLQNVNLMSVNNNITNIPNLA